MYAASGLLPIKANLEGCPTFAELAARVNLRLELANHDQFQFDWESCDKTVPILFSMREHQSVHMAGPLTWRESSALRGLKALPVTF